MNFRSVLAVEFEPHGALSEAQVSYFEEHYNRLIHWNRQLNLTRITSLVEAVRLHYCESLFMARVLPLDAVRVADIGSGAGFPGIPIAVLRPDCHVLLMEAHQRKAVFLREATRQLANVAVISRRAEESDLTANWMVSRAVDPERVLSLGVAPRAAILLSSSELARFRDYESVVSVPWGRERVIATFHVKHDKIDKRGKSDRDYEPKGRRRKDDDRH